MKGAVANRVVDFTAELNKFTQVWAEIKPSKVAIHDREVAKITLLSMKQVREDFAKMKQTATVINSDCKAFDMPPADFPGLDNLDEEIKAYEESWSFYNNFTTEVCHFYMI